MFHPEREEVAHYFRFQEIYLGRRFAPGDTPQVGPDRRAARGRLGRRAQHAPEPAQRRLPEGSEIREQMEAFNHAYSGVLHLLDETFNGSPRLLGVATGAMYGLKAEAIALMKLPSGDGDTTVGPSFEYVPPEQRHWIPGDERRIVVLPGGPYLVYGDIPLVRKLKIVLGEQRLADLAEDRGDRDRGHLRALPLRAVQPRSRSATARTRASGSRAPRSPTRARSSSSSASSRATGSRCGASARSACTPRSASAGSAGSRR